MNIICKDYSHEANVNPDVVLNDELDFILFQKKDSNSNFEIKLSESLSFLSPRLSYYQVGCVKCRSIFIHSEQNIDITGDLENAN